MTKQNRGAFRTEAKEHGAWMTRATAWIVFGVLMFGVVGTAVYVSKPVWLGFERRAFVASHQYVEAHRTRMTDIVREIGQLDVGISGAVDGRVRSALQRQRALLLSELSGIVDKVPPDAVPPRVRRLVPRS